MLGFGRARQRQAAGELYTRIVAQARQPVFYASLAVPDTIEGRLELVSLHCHAVLRRMRLIGSAAEPAARALLQYMFDDLDRSIREVGVGDVSIGKYMKRLGKGFYGRAEAYDRALDAGDRELLAEALKRNILSTAEIDEAEKTRAAHSLARYTAAMSAHLVAMNLEALHGSLSFPEVIL